MKYKVERSKQTIKPFRLNLFPKRSFGYITSVEDGGGDKAMIGELIYVTGSEVAYINSGEFDYLKDVGNYYTAVQLEKGEVITITGI